MDSFYFLN